MSFSRTRLPAAVMACSLLLLTFGSWPASTAAPSPGGAPDGAEESAGSHAVRIGTYNIRAGVGLGDFRSAVLQLKPRVDVAGLQEVNSKEKAEVLESLSGWGTYRPARYYGEQNPVIWDEAELDLVSARSVRTAAACTGSEVRREKQRAHYATVVRLRHRDSGQNVVVVNSHLFPGAVKAGRRTPGRAELFRCYTSEVLNTRNLAAAESSWGQVFAMGDFNAGWVADEKWQRPRLPFRRFLAVDMESMWATERPASPVGTHNDALIDQVFSTERAASASVETDITYSDHLPGIAGYLLG